MEIWAAKELETADLGDARRKKRFIRIVEDLAAKPSSSVPQACGNIAATKAAYNFWKSPYIQASDIRNGHVDSSNSLVNGNAIFM